MITEYKCNLPEEVRRYAEETLGETESAREDGLLEIRRWLEEERPWLNGRTETEAILPFLRGCKYDVERAKRKLEGYYKMKAEAPEWFSQRDPTLAGIEELVRLGVVVPLRRIVDNRIVIITRIHACDPKRFHINDLIKVGKMLLDVVAAENEVVSIFGLTSVVDMGKVGFSLARQMTPSVIRKTARMLLNDPWRINRIEFVNVPFYVHFAIRIFKAFISEKLRGRIVIDRDLGALRRNVGVEALPKEYGGDAEEIDVLTDYWYGKLVEYKDWFESDERHKADLP